MTPEEAEAELKKAKRAPLSKDEIDSLVRRVVSGEIDEEPVSLRWGEEELDEELAGEVLQLNRNAGDEDADTTKRLNELREELLNDDDDKNSTAE